MLNDRMLAGLRCDSQEIWPAGVHSRISSKGCVTFSPVEITHYESFKANQDGELTELAWVYAMNRWNLHDAPGAKRNGRSPRSTRSRIATSTSPSSTSCATI